MKSEDIAKGFERELDRKIKVYYEVNYTKSPVFFDIVHFDVENNEEIMRTKCIIEFFSSRKMQINWNLLRGKTSEDALYSLTRPKDFESKKSFVLTKVE